MNTPDEPPQRWSQRLWSDIEWIYGGILAHPFIEGLIDGTLDEKVFGHYVAQDVHYLRDYARALAVVGAKAPTLSDTAMFSRHAAEVFDVEMALHDTLLPDLGLDQAGLADVPVAPTTRAYTSYLLATVYGGSFVDGLAAILPCYWIYQRVGEELAARGSTDARYQRWIDSYGGPEFAATVAEVLALADRIGADLTPADEAAARAHFVTTSRYEWMFFDAAYRLEDWPVSPVPTFDHPVRRWEDIPGWFGWRAAQEEAVGHFADGDRFVEVGSYLGRSLCSLAEVVQKSGRSLRIVGVDTCQGSGPEGNQQINAHGPAVEFGGGTFAGLLHRNILGCGYADLVQLLITDSLSAASLFDDGSLAWVHIDARHDYASVRADIAAWSPKVRPGGWLSGDDYHPEWWPGVVAAVGDSLPDAREWTPGQWRWIKDGG